MKQLAISGAVSLLCSLVQAQTFAYTPGHFYAINDLEFLVEWDENLQLVRETDIVGISGATGLTFNNDGNLVCLADYLGSDSTIEIDANANILKSTSNMYSGLLNSHIDYDESTGRYVHADGDAITIIDADFNHIATSTDVLDRATGVLFSQSGLIYAVETFRSNLTIFNHDLSVVDSFNIGVSRNAGIDELADGTLLITNFINGIVYKYDVDSRTRTVFLDGFENNSIYDVLVLPNGNIAVQGQYIWIFDPAGNLISQSDFYPRVSYGIAYYVPSPTGTSVVLFATLALTQRRRMGFQ